MPTLSTYDQKIAKIAATTGNRELARYVWVKNSEWMGGVDSPEQLKLLEKYNWNTEEYVNAPDTPQFGNKMGVTERRNYLYSNAGITDKYGKVTANEKFRQIALNEQDDLSLWGSLKNAYLANEKDVDYRLSESSNNAKIAEDQWNKTIGANTLIQLASTMLFTALGANAIQSIFSSFSGSGFVENPFTKYGIPMPDGWNYDPQTGKITDTKTVFSQDKTAYGNPNSGSTISDPTEGLPTENQLKDTYTPQEPSGTIGSTTLFGDLTPSVNPLGMPEKNDQVFASINETKLPQVKQFSTMTPTVIKAPETRQLFGSM